MAQHNPHALPGWATWVQDNWFLSFLVIAEAYVLGTLMTLGWVPNIEDPSTWGWFHGLGVPIFFLAGATGGGLAVRTSMKAASSFVAKRYGFALGNLLGLLLISGIEVWGSLSERAANLTPGPADRALLAWLGITSGSVSPTVIMVALFLPFVAIWWGFSSEKHEDPPVETAETVRHRLENERLIAEHKRAEALANARARRAQVAAYLHREPDEAPAEDGTVAPDEAPVVTEASPALSERETGEHRAITAIGVPRSLITATELRAEIARRYGAEITQDAAAALIKTVKGAHQVLEARGQPWAAPRGATLSRAKAQYSREAVVVAAS